MVSKSYSCTASRMNRVPTPWRTSIAVSLLVLWPTMSPAQLGANWTAATTQAGWGYRNEHTSVVFDGKMWVIGGFGNGARTNEAWYSSDGVTWNQATAAAPWDPRQFHTSLVYDGKMWVIGGEIGTASYISDVWSSTDGASWIPATESAPWGPRGYHMSVVFDGKMWVIGGLPFYSDVWYSTDGAQWTLATQAADFGFRSRGTAVVYNGRIWVMGGNGARSAYTNDVWSSPDGSLWTQATAAAAWRGRLYHTSVVYDDKMWVLGGATGSNTNSNDVWYSTDGATWNQATGNADWAARLGHSSVVFDNKMWVIGGFGFFSGEDAWYSGGGSIRGTVVNGATGAPLACAAVRVTGSGVDRVTTADVNGKFHFEALPLSNYALEGFAPGHDRKTFAVAILTPSVYYQNIALAAAASPGLIFGVVTDGDTGNPLPGVQIDVSTGRVVLTRTYTCANGSYEIPSFASNPTTLSLRFSAKNYDAKTIAVPIPPRKSQEVNTTMAKSSFFPGSLVGVVTHALSHAPIAGVQVTLTGGLNMTAPTDAAGVYQFAALPEDSYSVRASANGFTEQLQPAAVSGAQITTVDFRLPPRGAAKYGDINGDSAVNALDVQLVINAALGLATGYDCDVKIDGAVNAVDVQHVINAALGLKLGTM